MDAIQLATIFGSAQIVVKILGPTADYLGEGIKGWAEKRAGNVERIFSIAEKKLGDRIDQDESVPTKVLKSILDDGSFSEDPLAAEYFGGVLASSRSGIPRDDRGVGKAALVTRLSTYQIRAHFIFYKIVKKLYDGSSYNIGDARIGLQWEFLFPLMCLMRQWTTMRRNLLAVMP